MIINQSELMPKALATVKVARALDLVAETDEDKALVEEMFTMAYEFAAHGIRKVNPKVLSCLQALLTKQPDQFDYVILQEFGILPQSFNITMRKHVRGFISHTHQFFKGSDLTVENMGDIRANKEVVLELIDLYRSRLLPLLEKPE